MQSKKVGAAFSTAPVEPKFHRGGGKFQDKRYNIPMSYLKYGISQSKLKLLQDKMKQLKIRESDIIERFVRASGPGGQKVNKTSSCVYLKHKPTGIEVKCQKERSQALNRFLARRILVNKLEILILGKRNEELKRIEKIRRQKRKRSKRAKEKILKLKKLRSDKKQFRRLNSIREHDSLIE